MARLSIPKLELHQEQLPEGPEWHMIKVEGGRFQMGEDSAYQPKLDSFYLGQTAVTQALWQAVMDENPSYFKGSNLPVENVSWYDAVIFCNRMSALQGLEAAYEIDQTIQDPDNQNEYDELKWLVKQRAKANGYRLPTEAEWEFAARGGNANSGYIYAGSDELAVVGWYRDNSHGESQPVGLKAPNELGFYDLSGNVWEWCWDWYGDDYYQQCYEQVVVKNPTGPIYGRPRVLRGGSWVSVSSLCRVAYRLDLKPGLRVNYIGLRLSRTAL